MDGPSVRVLLSGLTVWCMGATGQVNDMVRELFKQLKVLSDAHSVAQRKLDAILAGQHM